LSCEDVFLLQQQSAEKRILLKENKDNGGAGKGESFASSQSSINKKGGWRKQLGVSNTSREEWSRLQNEIHILKRVSDFEEYSHGFKHIKGIETKELEKLYEVHMKEK